MLAHTMNVNLGGGVMHRGSNDDGLPVVLADGHKQLEEDGIALETGSRGNWVGPEILTQ